MRRTFYDICIYIYIYSYFNSKYIDMIYICFQRHSDPTQPPFARNSPLFMDLNACTAATLDVYHELVTTLIPLTPPPLGRLGAGLADSRVSRIHAIYLFFTIPFTAWTLQYEHAGDISQIRGLRLRSTPSHLDRYMPAARKPKAPGMDSSMTNTTVNVKLRLVSLACAA